MAKKSPNDKSMKVVPEQQQVSVKTDDPNINLPYTHTEETTFTDDQFSELENSNEVGELSVDVFHNDAEIVVIAPIAGITSKDFSINVTQGVLTIRGRRGFSFDVAASDYVTKECFWGAFSRNIILPDHVDVTKIKASFKNGILAVRVPKLKPLEVKVVEIDVH